MIAKSIQGRTSKEVNTALHRAMADSYSPTLAIVFISIKQDRRALCEVLHSKGISKSLKGKQEFHSTTCCLVALKEK